MRALDTLEREAVAEAAALRHRTESESGRRPDHDPKVIHWSRCPDWGCASIARLLDRSPRS